MALGAPTFQATTRQLKLPAGQPSPLNSLTSSLLNQQRAFQAAQGMGGNNGGNRQWITYEGGPPSASIPPGGPATPSPRPPGAGNPMPPTSGGIPAYVAPNQSQLAQDQVNNAQTSLQQALDFFGGLSGPQQEILRQQASRIFGQVGMLEANADNSRSLLQDQFGIDLAGLNLNRQSNDIALAGIARELDLLNKSGTLDSRQFNEAMQNLGLDRGDIERSLGSIGQLENLANLLHGQQLKGFGIDETEATRLRDLGLSEAGRTKDVGIRTTRSDATARGAITSGGQRAVESDIQGQYGDTVTGIHGRYGDTMGRTGIARDTSALRRMEQQVGFEDQRGQLGSDQARVKNAEDLARIGFDRQGIENIRAGGNLEDQKKQLNLRAWQMGLDEDTLKNTLQQGLNRIGIDTAMSVGDLMDALTSNDLQARQVAEQIYTTALGYAGFFNGGNSPIGLPGARSAPGQPGSTSPPARNPDTGQRAGSRLNLTGSYTQVGGREFDTGFAPIVQAILDIPGTRLTSGRRSPAQNAAVGGVPNSQHLRGSAADIVATTPDQKNRIRTIARGYGLEVIDEGDHLHIEMR